MLADGANPNPPTTWAASSDKISPNIFVVTITSNSFGFLIKFIAQASTYISENIILEFFCAILFAHSANNPSVIFNTLDL